MFPLSSLSLSPSLSFLTSGDAQGLILALWSVVTSGVPITIWWSWNPSGLSYMQIKHLTSCSHYQPFKGILSKEPLIRVLIKVRCLSCLLLTGFILSPSCGSPSPTRSNLWAHNPALVMSTPPVSPSKTKPTPKNTNQ